MGVSIADARPAVRISLVHSSNAVGCLRGACQLGRGHWGEVFLGRSDAANNDGQLVAIKVMPLEEGVPSLLQREADVLSAVGDQVGFPALLPPNPFAFIAATSAFSFLISAAFWVILWRFAASSISIKEGDAQHSPVV